MHRDRRGGLALPKAGAILMFASEMIGFREVPWSMVPGKNLIPLCVSFMPSVGRAGWRGPVGSACSSRGRTEQRSDLHAAEEPRDARGNARPRTSGKRECTRTHTCVYTGNHDPPPHTHTHKSLYCINVLD